MKQEVTANSDVVQTDTNTIDEGGRAAEPDSQLDQTKSFNTTSQQSWWLLKIIYNIVRGVELIINFVKVWLSIENQALTPIIIQGVLLFVTILIGV